MSNKHAAGCLCCGCVYEVCDDCDEGEGPCEFDVTIANLSAGATGCSSANCSALNDTYTADKTGNPCEWQVNAGLACLTFVTVTVFIDGSNYKVKVLLSAAGGDIEFVEDYGTTAPTCRDFSSESITLSANNSDCDGSTPTCTLTAV